MLSYRVFYALPISERFGTIAVVPELENLKNADFFEIFTKNVQFLDFLMSFNPVPHCSVHRYFVAHYWT